MTERDKLGEFLDKLARRAVDLAERECAVEDGCDHHVVLVLLAAGNVLLSGLSHTDAPLATATMLPDLCSRAHAEALRRLNECDPTKN